MKEIDYKLITDELSEFEYSLSNCLKGMVWNSQRNIHCSLGEAQAGVNFLKFRVEEYCEAYLRQTAINREKTVAFDMKGFFENIKK